MGGSHGRFVLRLLSSFAVVDLLAARLVGGANYERFTCGFQIVRECA